MSVVDRLTFEAILEQTLINETSKDILVRADEPITRGLRTVNTDHGAIHSGWGFCAHLYHASLATTARQVYRFKGPTTLYAHIKSIQAGVIGETITVKLIKDPTITNAGTIIADALQNLNHNATQTAQSALYDGGVTYTGGTTWCEVIVRGSTSGGIQVKASSTFVQSDYLEYVTRDGDTDYILEIENIGTATAEDISIDIFFYEEPLGIA